MQVFKDQLTIENYYLDFLYSLAAMCVVLIVLGIGFIDGGLVRTKNMLDAWVQKIGAAIIGGLSTLVFGYALWQWSFNQAFGVPNPLKQALKDWWIGGPNVTTFATYIDPKILPEADTQQIFLLFFMTFSMATMALVHSAVVERIKALPLYTVALVVGLITSPLAGYLCWGSVSPLTNRGVHDFDGVYPLYIFAGTTALVLAWRLKPRRGIALGAQASVADRPPTNLWMTGAGAMIIVFALPFVALGSGYIVPGEGFFGISMTSSGFGIVMINVLTAFLAGGVGGLLIAYKERQAAWVFLGPISGAIICGALFDVGRPWDVAILAFFGPFVTLLGQKLMIKLGIDDPKVVPLALCNGVVGTIATGFIAWGDKTGGYFGLEGKYGFQHASINPGWQAIGALAIIALAGIPTLIIALIFEKTSGLAVDDAGQDAGLDHVYWDHAAA